jgi:hypothetical protein
VFAADGSCREILQKFLAWLALTEQRTASPSTAAYCSARGRLRVDTLTPVHAQIANAMEAGLTEDDLWYGRRVKVIDGSSVSMPDTPENQAAYPQPSGQKPGCGFPVMRIVAVFSLATGMLLALAKGALHIGEGALFRTLWTLLCPGDIVLTDCGLCSYAHAYLLSLRGVDLVMRNHQRRKVAFHVLKRFGPGDRLVLWHKTSACPNWMSPKQWDALPDTLRVRELDCRIHIPGFRTRSFVVVTTLLNPKAFPKHAFTQLYRRRWMAELFLRDIKTTMRFDILRCKTPDMIEKELWMHLIAYNLIRALMREAATSHHVPIERISFKGALATIREWTPLLASDLHPSQRQCMTALLLKYLGRDLLPCRPNRSEPRARKRRPKNYPLLTKPRNLFLEIRHRNRYKKPLT